MKMAAQSVTNQVSSWLGPLLQPVAPITPIYLRTRIFVSHRFASQKQQRHFLSQSSS